MKEDSNTKPTLGTVLERINALGDSLNQQIASVNQRIDSLERRIGSLEQSTSARFEALEARFGALEERIEIIDSRLDRQGAIMLELRANNRDIIRALNLRVGSIEDPR